MVEYLRFLAGVSKNATVAPKAVTPVGDGQSKIVINYGKDANYQTIFNQYVDNQKSIMQDVAEKLEERIRSMNNMKAFHAPISAERFKDDPGYAYFS